MDRIEPIDAPRVQRILHKRSPGEHKGNFGTVLVVAGSHGMMGAAILCVRGALRSGAGLVRVAIPNDAFPIVQTACPEAICQNRDLKAEQLGAMDSIVIGPGLGTGDDIAEGICRIIKESTCALILDADALNQMARDSQVRDAVLGAANRVVLTPHPGEAGRILGCSSSAVNADRIQSAKQLAEQYGGVIVLKGAGTIVHAPGRSCFVNETGNPGMATGGTGDVLSGIIGGFSAQGHNPLSAAIAGTYIHGAAGDLARAALGEYGVLASDVASQIGIAIENLIEKKK